MSTQNNQNQQDPWRVTTGDSINLFYVLANIHATAITPLMRNTFGTRAFDPQVIFSLFVLMGLAMRYPAFQIYIIIWFFAVIIHRAQSFNGKYRVHSRYPGYPWLAMRLPYVNTEEQAREKEPLVCFFAGLIVLGLSPPIGLFLMSGFFSLLTIQSVTQLVVRRQLQAMRDAEIEMHYYTEKFRERG